MDATCEVCPHHLVLDEDDAEAIGALAKCGPPLRPAAEIEGLWQALEAGEIGWIASDHSPAPPDMKVGDDMFAVWGGIAGAQTTLALTLTHGMRRGLAAARLAVWLSSAPAERFGLAGKGAPEGRGGRRHRTGRHRRPLGGARGGHGVPPPGDARSPAGRSRRGWSARSCAGRPSRSTDGPSASRAAASSPPGDDREVELRRPGGHHRSMFREEFDGPELDTSVWLPHYLPAWSSRAASAATHEVAGSCLRLSIPPDQGLWMAGEQDPPLRVSGVQTGNFSGPAGSRIGQQPLPGGSTVREEQPRFEGFLPLFGELEMRARMTISARSMAAWWMVGFEDRPERSAEICVFEVFGDAVEPGRSAAVGMGLHPFRDPAITDDFAAVPLPIDVAQPHDYAVRWTPAEAVFSVDGAEIRRCPAPSGLPDADDGRGLRLPGALRRLRRPPGPGVGRRPPPLDSSEVIVRGR